MKTRPSLLDHSLRIFTDVRAGEGYTALLMFVNIFLILCAYYFIKPLREGWIAVSDVHGLTKVEVKAYSSFAQSILLIPVVWLYGRVSDHWSRRKLIIGATLFCMTNMVVFWVLQPDYFFAKLPLSGIFFYLWVGMFGVFVVAQFWAFAADVYSGEQGDRLLPMIAIGATAGAASGSWITEVLLKFRLIRTEWLLMVALMPLAISLFLTAIVDRRQPPLPTPDTEPQQIEGGSSRGAFWLVFSSRFLLTTAIITILLSWVNTNGENLLFRVLQAFLKDEALAQGIVTPNALLHYTRDATIGFYGNFYFWVNLVALLLQAFVASRLLKYGGFGALFLMLPIITMVSYSTMALVPVLIIVKMMKIAENATDYSISNTARHVLWLPLPAAVKYKGKPTIDTLFVRVGDGIAALTVLIGVGFLALPTPYFFILNVALVLVWIGFAVVVVRERRRLVGSGEMAHEQRLDQVKEP
jgi:AAA family ATP:ADP antiporter